MELIVDDQGSILLFMCVCVCVCVCVVGGWSGMGVLVSYIFKCSRLCITSRRLKREWKIYGSEHAH